MPSSSYVTRIGAVKRILRFRRQIEFCPYFLHFTWGVQVVRSPNFFSREWKQIETWKLLEETWLFFRLGEAKWQHCTTRWMLLTRSSCSSVFDTEMATFTFEEQRVIIRLLHLRGMKPIEIHQQLSETCSDGVMDVKNVRSWVRQFKEGRTSCENNLKEPRPLWGWTPKEAFAAAMQSWHERCEKCVCLPGGYVEKWLHFQLPVVSIFL